MAYRNKTYICFDADSDIHYYYLMKAWKQNDNTEFNFHDAHDINNLMPYSSEATIKKKLRERLNETKVFVVLIGENTRYLYKFVRWEMEIALNLERPIIGVNLNGRRSRDNNLCPPIIRDELALYVSFNSRILQYALENWPQFQDTLRNKGNKDPYYYEDSVYQSFGL